METINFELLIDIIKSYNEEEVEIITKAYEYAKKLHNGQKRESGEEYILHPLNVAYILSEMRADRDTICAGLLHDVIEDTDVTKKEITNVFNKTIGNLVDGVTKISKMNFSSRDDAKCANTKKIITGITEDVRIVIIKLADRLHNMRTLQYRSEFKQKENALETMEIYVPLAYYIGAYRMKSELEDLSFKYLKPDVYNDIQQKMMKINNDSNSCLKEMSGDISNILNDENIPHEIKVRTKNIYGIYKRLKQNHTTHDIHDLLALKIMVDNIKSCYYTLGIVHSKYPPINSEFKDYISMPKTNMYKSLHTTVFGPEENLVQTQIRTFDMDKIASFGLTAYWDMNKGAASTRMNGDLNKNFQFFKSLNEIKRMTGNDQEFVDSVKNELFMANIYVYTPKGSVVELPKGSTPIDFAYKISTEVGNSMIGAMINNKNVDINSVLKSKDIIKIITDDMVKDPQPECLNTAQTVCAKRKIKGNINKKHNN